MYRQGLLLFAAVVLIATGFAHSYLGERYMFKRLFALADLPLFRRDRAYTERVLRFAWHITSFGWFGFAVILALLAVGQTSVITGAIAAILALNGVVIVTTCGLRHPAWPLSFIAGIAIWFAV